MKICVMSDLHLEFEPQQRSGSRSCRRQLPAGILHASEDALALDADVVILAGDIHTRTRGPAWAATAFRGIPVVMLGGNHEAYRDSLHANISKHRALASKLGTLPDGTQQVNWLERESWSWKSAGGECIRVVGATLWTDFNMFGEDQREHVQAIARHGLNDFQSIRILDETSERKTTRIFDPEDAARIHRLSVDSIRVELAKPFDGITVVATHHAPSLRSVSEQFRNDPLSAAYASDLEPMIEELRPPLWVHGHMHTSLDYSIGSTRIVCNARGYWPDDLNLTFQWGKTVEM